MPRGKRNRKGKNGKKSNPFHYASTQGIGSTEDWVINDLQIATLPQSASPGLYTVRIAMDLNGYSITVADNGTAVSTFPSNTFFNYNYPYGYGNNQFQRLSLLWEEYRIDSVEMETIPAAAGGAISSTGVFSLIDEAGLLQGYTPLGDLIPKLASQKTLRQHTPYLMVKRSFDYARWLGQSQQRAWLQTQAPGTTQIIREFYDTETISSPTNAPIARTPALCMVFGVNSLASVATVIGSVKFRVKYSFRQRAALDNAPVLGSTVTFREEQDGRQYKDVRKSEPDPEDKVQTSGAPTMTKSQILSALGVE